MSQMHSLCPPFTTIACLLCTPYVWTILYRVLNTCSVKPEVGGITEVRVCKARAECKSHFSNARLWALRSEKINVTFMKARKQRIGSLKGFWYLQGVYRRGCRECRRMDFHGLWTQEERELQKRAERPEREPWQCCNDPWFTSPW